MIDPAPPAAIIAPAPDQAELPAPAPAPSTRTRRMSSVEVLRAWRSAPTTDDRLQTLGLPPESA
jgi:hypothetical protein